MRSAAIRLSEVREQINQGALDAMPKEQLESLRKESIALETEYRAEILAAGHIDGEIREIQGLHGRVQATDYVQAALEERAVGGAAVEYNAALHIPPNHFPLALSWLP